ncbi:MAG: hypothetical protein M3032_04520 [Verrucomicrobiota bacterium]|nr:hypothetical protein [Verrucomicrobiota bacterium]
MFYQFVSLVGAALILAGYIALQRGWLDRGDRLFNILNFAGSALITWIAVLDWRVGFVILEAAWALLSIPGMFRRPKRASA